MILSKIAREKKWMTYEAISHFSRKACKKAGLCYPEGDFPVQGNSRDLRSWKWKCNYQRESQISD